VFLRLGLSLSVLPTAFRIGILTWAAATRVGVVAVQRSVHTLGYRLTLLPLTECVN
jgi:hypothetical protein